MGTGYIRVQVSVGDEALPVTGAEVIIKESGNGANLYITTTDESGKTEDFTLPAPCFRNTLYPYTTEPAYSLCDIEVRAAGFVTQRIRGIEIIDTQTTILPVHMEPISDERYPERSLTTDISPNGQTCLRPCPIREASPARSRNEVIIPDFITVHLGNPQDTAARNVRVSFVEYIKNVTYTKHQTC